MGNNRKNKSGPKPNVFKVAGAKSLKKGTTKAVHLGLKNITSKNISKKVEDMNAQLVNLQEKVINVATKKEGTPKPQKNLVKKDKAKVKTDTNTALDNMEKMEL